MQQFTNFKKSFLTLGMVAFTVVLLSSCHRSGCPSQITDVETPVMQTVDQDC